ncbi:MAG: DUF3843 family protein, partial [Tannerella sp.]|nr:DUF3843 family protein [Tannerella sp.]
LHPYDKANSTDMYYVNLCNKVLRIIQKSELVGFFETRDKQISLALVLVAYFEDVISDTNLFAAFTRKHKELYGKPLPFFNMDEEYYEEDILLNNILFLTWYQLALENEEIIPDPQFDDNLSIVFTITDIYNLFDCEFENAPINGHLQECLQLPENPDVLTVRNKLMFIAQSSYLWKKHFSLVFKKTLEPYMKNGVVVINDENDNVKIYNSQINFVYNECLPLLAMRATEYYAEVLGKEHPEYQFIKNISKQEFGLFLVKKINSDNYLLEHFPSKTEIVLSKEFSSYEDSRITENESVMCVGVVNWKNNIRQMMGGSFLMDKSEAKTGMVGDHIFDDMAQKLEITENMGKAFLKINHGKKIAYLKGKQEFDDLNCEVRKTYIQIIVPNISDKKLNENLEIFKKTQNDVSLEEDSPVCVFFNSKSGIEIYNDVVCHCISDKKNPFYTGGTFDLEQLVTEPTLSKEFIDYIIENKIIKLELDKDNFSPDVFPFLMDSLDFLLRFYRREKYWSEPTVSIENYTDMFI